MSLLTIGSFEKQLVVGGTGRKLLISETASEQRDAAAKVFEFLISECPREFLDALTRRLIANKAEHDLDLAYVLGCDSKTRHLLGGPR